MTTTALPLASVGIDIGKEAFHVVGSSRDVRLGPIADEVAVHAEGR